MPKDFTYAECEGAGGDCTTATGTTSGTGTGTGGASACGNGTIDAAEGEECDDGPMLSDDHADTTVGLIEDGPLGCTRSCKHTVQWTRVDQVADQSVFTGVVATSTGVVAGGFSLGGDTSIILNRSDVAYSADRRIRAFDAAGGDLFSIASNDAGLEGNGVLGMVPATGDRIFFLESYHDSGVDRGTFVKLRDAATTLKTSGKTSAEDFTVAIGSMDGGNGAIVVAYDLGGMVLRRVGASGSVTDIDISAVSSIAGDGPGGAITTTGSDIAIAWGSNVVLLDAIGNEKWTIPVPGSELTGICLRPDGVLVAVGWNDLGGSYDPIVAWVDPAGALLGSVVIDEVPDVDGANAVACDADGSVVVVGEEGLDGETSGLTPRSRAWVRRFASDRSLVWTRKHESYAGLGISDTDARAVAIDAEGFIYVAGREMTTDDTASGWLRKYAP